MNDSYKFERQDAFDILKAVCAFLIVCIHIPFPGAAGAYFTALTRIAVPIFFMITGYFYSDVVRRGKEKKQLKKIFLLVVEANMLYLLWKGFYTVVSGERLIPFLTSAFTFRNILKFVFLNESPLGSHLWYLGAILYVLIIVKSADRLRSRKLLYIATPLLLLGDLVLGKYSLLLLHREFPYILVRNFLFVGIPYFCIGCLLHDKRERLCHIGKPLLTALAVLFSITSLAERAVLVSMNMNPTRDHYISTTFLAMTIFCFAVTANTGRGKAVNFLSVIGRKYSTGIYIVHPIFITVLSVFMRKIGCYGVYKFFAPICVYLVSAIAVAVLYKLKSLFKDRGSDTSASAECSESTKYINRDSAKKNLPELYEKKENCCGCSACFAVCPVRAIVMEPDEEGFLYPAVDALKCIGCYRCLKVCSFKEKQKEKEGFPS